MADDRDLTGKDWGRLGFVVSLVSFGTCGLLSPISLILSLFGRGKYPFGDAIAGIVVSLAQISAVVFIGITPLWMIVCTGAAGAAAMIAGMKRFG